MAKKNVFLRIAAVVMIAALFATCILSGTTTLARYAQVAKGDTTTDLATWSILINGEDMATAIGVDLFDSILCEGTEGGAYNELGEEETDTNGKVAPGTYGEFELEIENAGDVTARITVDLVCDAADIPISIGGGITGAFVLGAGEHVFFGDVANLPAGATLEGDAVTWEWLFEDGSDTDLGDGTTGWEDDMDFITNYVGDGTLEATLTVYAVQVD